MKNIVIHDCEQLSEAWHELKLGRITGTRFSKLMMGESTAGYKDLITDLACEIISGEKDEPYVNQDMQNGIDNEDFAAVEYEAVMGIKLKRVGFISPDITSPFEDWIGVSPDRVYENYEGMIEIKCPKARTHLNYIKDGKLPYEYKHQVQGQLFVTGFPFCDFVSWAKGMKLFIIRVYPDLELHAKYEEALHKLIARVQEEINIHSKYEIL